MSIYHAPDKSARLSTNTETAMQSIAHPSKNYECIFDGTAVSDCPVPCTSTSAVAKEEDVSIIEDGSDIDITFFETILVTTTSFPVFSFSDALAKLGGAMGLWLGLGIMQVLEISLSIRQRLLCKGCVK